MSRPVLFFSTRYQAIFGTNSLSAIKRNKIGFDTFVSTQIGARKWREGGGGQIGVQGGGLLSYRGCQHWMLSTFGQHLPMCHSQHTRSCDFCDSFWNLYILNPFWPNSLVCPFHTRQYVFPQLNILPSSLPRLASSLPSSSKTSSPPNPSASRSSASKMTTRIQIIHPKTCRIISL